MDYEYSIIRPNNKPIEFKNKIELVNWLHSNNISVNINKSDDMCYYIGNNSAILKINPCIKYNITSLYKKFINPKRLHKFTYCNKKYYVYTYKDVMHVFIINRFGNTQELKRCYDNAEKSSIYRFTIGNKKMTPDTILKLCGGNNEI